MRFRINLCTQDPREWHRWFAWHLVFLENRDQLAWFEDVFRMSQSTMVGAFWKYMAVEDYKE
jgi:hypothetical protein